MTLTIIGKGKGYTNGKLTLANGKYKLIDADVEIGNKGIISISNGIWKRLK